jgi:hypothetical protein
MRWAMEKFDKAVNKRFAEIRDFFQLTQDEFGGKIHLGHGQISSIELCNSKLKEQNIHLICTPDLFETGKTVNGIWLRTGKGKMFEEIVNSSGNPKLTEEGKGRIPSDEEELVGIYRKLTKPNKRVARKQINVLLEGQYEEKRGTANKQEAERKSG